MDLTLDEVLEEGRTYTAFADHWRPFLTSRDLEEVIERSQSLLSSGASQAVMIFDDATGRRTDVELGPNQIRERLHPDATADRSGPGRPKLGVVSREISLLPRHWEWLATQPGGASAAIRRLVEEARKNRRAEEASRLAREALDKALTVLGGSRPNFEEALRALYAGQFLRLEELIAEWPEELRAHISRLTGQAQALHVLAQAESAQ